MVLLVQVTPQEDTGIYDDQPHCWYIETTPGDTKMSAGDALRISSMSLDYEGGTVKVFYQGELVGSMTLPIDFP